MKKIILAFSVFGAVAGCVSAPSSPEERVARDAAQARLVASECTAYVGGVQGIRELQQYAGRTEEKAKKMGADDALIQKARTDAVSAFGMVEALVGKPEGCSMWLNEVVTEMG